MVHYKVMYLSTLIYNNHIEEIFRKMPEEKETHKYQQSFMTDANLRGPSGDSPVLVASITSAPLNSSLISFYSNRQCSQ